MQGNQLETSSSSGGSINGGNRRSLSLPNPGNPNLSPSTSGIPLLPSRFGPLQYVDPAYIGHLESILRSFPTGTDPAEVYTSLKDSLGISRHKDPASPLAADSLFSSSNLLLRRREAEGNLFSTMEDDSASGRIHHPTKDQLLREAEILRRQVEKKKANNLRGRSSHGSKQDCGGQPGESRGREREERGRKCPPPS